MVDTFNRLRGATATVAGKKPCRASSTGANLFLSGYQTIDGIAFNSTAEAAGYNMRALVRHQSAASENGIYLVNSGLWTREADFDGTDDFVEGTPVFVPEGTVFGGSWFYVSAPLDAPEVGVDDIEFTLYSANQDILTTLASATTVDLSVVAKSIIISGSVTITSFGSTANAGVVKFISFSGAPILIASANLILPGPTPAEALQAAAGDCAIVRHEGSGVWRFLSYVPGNGLPLEAGLTTLASAASTDFGSVRERCIFITGATNITSFGSDGFNGEVKFVEFAGAMLLSHSANLILPGTEDITTVAGDAAIFRFESAASAWRCLVYVRGNSQPLIVGAASIDASGGTPDLGAVREQSITLTGGGTVTSFGASAATGVVKYIELAAATVLTYNATSLILPGGASINGQPGDTFLARHEGSGNWRILNFQRAIPQGYNFAQFSAAGVSNIDTAEDTLMSHVLAPVASAFPLNSSGQFIRVKAFGVTSSSSANARRMRLYFGATVVADSGAVLLSSGTAWELSADIGRVSSAAQMARGFAASGLPSVLGYTPSISQPAENLGSSIGTTIKVTGLCTNAGSSGTILQQGLTIELVGL